MISWVPTILSSIADEGLRVITTVRIRTPTRAAQLGILNGWLLIIYDFRSCFVLLTLRQKPLSSARAEKPEVIAVRRTLTNDLSSRRDNGLRVDFSPRC